MLLAFSSGSRVLLCCRRDHLGVLLCVWVLGLNHEMMKVGMLCLAVRPLEIEN